MPTTKKTTTATKKTSTSTTRKKSSATKKKTTNTDSIVNTMDKEKLVSGLQQTMKDVGKLPGIFLAPVIAYVSSKYDSIPVERRKKLEEIVKTSKEQGGSVLTKIKDWFMSRYDDVSTAVTTDTDKKKTSKKKTSKKAPAKSATKKKTVTSSTTRAKKSTPRKTSTKKATE